MPELKLAKLPDRTPIKLSISISPNLSEALAQYASVYAETYGRAEAIVDLVPAMLSNFLESDKGFAKARQLKRGS